MTLEVGRAIESHKAESRGGQSGLREPHRKPERTAGSSMWYSTLPSTSRGSTSTQFAKEGKSEQARRVVVRWNRAKRQHQREGEMILVRHIIGAPDTAICPGPIRRRISFSSSVMQATVRSHHPPDPAKVRTGTRPISSFTRRVREISVCAGTRMGHSGVHQ